jgi:hypothetical protein
MCTTTFETNRMDRHGGKHNKRECATCVICCCNFSNPFFFRSLKMEEGLFLSFQGEICWEQDVLARLCRFNGVEGIPREDCWERNYIVCSWAVVLKLFVKKKSRTPHNSERKTKLSICTLSELSSSPPKCFFFFLPIDYSHHGDLSSIICVCIRRIPKTKKKWLQYIYPIDSGWGPK